MLLPVMKVPVKDLLSPVTLVELASSSVRETALKKFSGTAQTDAAGGSLEITSG